MILMIIIMVSVSKMERMDIMWMILFSFLYLVEFFLMYLLFVWIEKKIIINVRNVYYFYNKREISCCIYEIV